MSNLSSQPPSGSMRSLTEVFILLRNNAIQSRHIFANQSFTPASKRRDDRERLIGHDASVDIETGVGSHEDFSPAAREPPEWVSVVDELQYELSRVRTRQRELCDLQQQHLNRPSFSDDNSNAEEATIDRATLELTQMLNHCNSLIKHVQEYEHATKTAGSRHLLHNTCTSLLMSVQQITEDVRNSQQTYLKRIQSRDDSVQQYFTHSAGGGDGATIDDVFGETFNKAAGSNVEWTANASSPYNKQEGGEVTMAQLQMIEQNEDLVRAREQDVVHITKSIIDLNTLFKDVAGLISEQGTILDRIDFNIERTDMRVKSALQSVQDAEKYQSGSRKMKCIVLLACAVLFMIFMFVVFKL